MNILFSVDENRMSNKDYSFLILAIANLNGYVDKELKTRVVNKSVLLYHMTERLGISLYKRKKILSALQELGACWMDEENVYIKAVAPPFVSMQDTMITTLVEQSYEIGFSAGERLFKTYIYLFQKQKVHKQFFRGQGGFYFFSNSEILDAIGYSRSQQNISNMTETLDLLMELGFIKYNPDSFGNYNQRGVYHPLYLVKGV